MKRWCLENDCFDCPFIDNCCQDMSKLSDKQVMSFMEDERREMYNFFEVSRKNGDYREKNTILLGWIEKFAAFFKASWLKRKGLLK